MARRRPLRRGFPSLVSKRPTRSESEQPTDARGERCTSPLAGLDGRRRHTQTFRTARPIQSCLRAGFPLKPVQGLAVLRVDLHWAAACLALDPGTPLAFALGSCVGAVTGIFGPSI